MNMHRVPIGGPAVDVVPVGDFTRLRSQDVDKLWSIIGPTVECNMQTQPLWKVFCACYAQGLENGSEMAKAMAKKQL